MSHIRRLSNRVFLFSKSKVTKALRFQYSKDEQTSFNMVLDGIYLGLCSMLVLLPFLPILVLSKLILQKAKNIFYEAGLMSNYIISICYALLFITITALALGVSFYIIQFKADHADFRYIDVFKLCVSRFKDLVICQCTVFIVLLGASYLFIFPALYLFLPLLFALPIILFFDVSAFKAPWTAVLLFKGSWLKTFYTLFLFLAVLLSFNIILVKLIDYIFNLNNFFSFNVAIYSIGFFGYVLCLSLILVLLHNQFLVRGIAMVEKADEG